MPDLVEALPEKGGPCLVRDGFEAGGAPADAARSKLPSWSLQQKVQGLCCSTWALSCGAFARLQRELEKAYYFAPPKEASVIPHLPPRCGSTTSGSGVGLLATPSAARAFRLHGSGTFRSRGHL